MPDGDIFLELAKELNEDDRVIRGFTNPFEDLPTALKGLGMFEGISKLAGQFLTAPFRPKPTIPFWRPPTEEETTRGIHAYQPTFAAEKAYKEWEAPGISTEFLHFFKLPWTKETKPWDVTVKTAAEEFPFLPIWVAGGGAGRTALSKLGQKAAKFEAKQIAGQTLKASEEAIIKKATEAEVKVTAQLAKPLTEPQLTKEMVGRLVELPTYEEMMWDVTKRFTQEKLVEKPLIRQLVSLFKPELTARNPVEQRA